MTRISARTLDFFDRHVTEQIIEKYGLDSIKAIRSFLKSETYQMLLEPELEIYKMSPRVVFDMWESELSNKINRLHSSGMSIDEIAEIIDITPKAINNYLP